MDETIEKAFGVLVDCCELYIKNGVRPPRKATQAIFSVARVYGGASRHEINRMASFLESLPERQAIERGG